MVTIESDGRIAFSLRRPEALQVDVVGTFEGWHERSYPMRRGDDGVWRLSLDPGPGTYLFRYRIDGRHWRLDEEAHGTCLAADGQVKSRVWGPPPRQDPDVIAA
jgi:1,4-alpha-glucan branching enzyme